jgi:hypothetical protein
MTISGKESSHDQEQEAGAGKENGETGNDSTDTFVVHGFDRAADW